jgi:hypothetical protein
MHEEIIATIPQKQQDTALEVVLIHDDAGASHIELRCMTWGAGIGWYRQKTLALDRDAARALVQNLGQARARLGRTRPPGHGNNVIPLAAASPRQQTADLPVRRTQRA